MNKLLIGQISVEALGSGLFQVSAPALSFQSRATVYSRTKHEQSTLLYHLADGKQEVVVQEAREFHRDKGVAATAKVRGAPNPCPLIKLSEAEWDQVCAFFSEHTDQTTLICDFMNI